MHELKTKYLSLIGQDVENEVNNSMVLDLPLDLIKVVSGFYLYIAENNQPIGLTCKKLNPDLTFHMKMMYRHIILISKSMPGYMGFFYILLSLSISLTKVAFHGLQVYKLIIKS